MSNAWCIIEITRLGLYIKVEKMSINLDDVLPKILAKMEANVKTSAAAQGLSEEEVEATWILNRKKVTEDAEKLAVFFKEAFAEEADQLPL